MAYLTFSPTKGRIFTPKLVKCLSVTADAFLLLLMMWNLANICYPFWGWTTFTFIWVGFVPYPLYAWVIRRLRIRSFMATIIPPNSKCPSDVYHNLKHFGFLFSVWGNLNAVILGYYHKNDQISCLRNRVVTLGCSWKHWKCVGWFIVLLTNAIPFVLFAALFSAGYHFGIGTILGFLMGFLLAWQLHTLCLRYGDSSVWENEIFLDGKMCTIKSLGVMMCILEEPEGRLFLSNIELLMFDHETRRSWFKSMASMPCPCCTSMMNPILREEHALYTQSLLEMTFRPVMEI